MNAAAFDPGGDVDVEEHDAAVGERVHDRMGKSAAIPLNRSSARIRQRELNRHVGLEV
ncbi:MAG: hypothetical protein ACLPY2_08365 [Bryobacteraceae bacterium]